MYTDKLQMEALLKGKHPESPSDLGFLLAFQITRYIYARKKVSFNEFATISGVLDAVQSEFKANLLHPLLDQKKKALGPIFPEFKPASGLKGQGLPSPTAEDVQKAWDAADKLMEGIIKKPGPGPGPGPKPKEDGQEPPPTPSS